MKTQTQSQTQTLQTLLLTFLALTTMVGCSSQSSNGSATTATSTSSGTLTSTLNTSGQAITNCSQSNANIADLNMQMEEYSNGGTLNPNLIRVRFSAFPATFTNSNGTIAFWAYSSVSNGTYTSEYPVPFYVEHYTGSSTFTAVSGEMNSITWSQISSLASSSGVSYSSAAVALQNITFVIDLTSVQYTSPTILNGAIYSNGPGSASAPVSPDRYIQGLIPSILANPSDYSSSHDSTLLALHPFYSSINAGYSESQFAAMGTALCF